jgi:hypothetical protein
MNEGIVINFKPSKKQDLALTYLFDNKTLFIGYGGSAFSGKSYLLCYWLTIMCVAYPETYWGLGRKELVTLKKTTLLTLFKVFRECNIQIDIDYSYNQQANAIFFKNGSVIFLIDMAYKPSDPLYTRFGGLELTGAAIDESAENDYKAIEILFTRLGRKNNHKYNICKKVLETFNPAKNHVYTRYYKPYKEDNQSNEIVFIPALPKDNPSPEVNDYVEGILKTANRVTIERLIYGNFEYDDDPTILIPYENIVNCFSNIFVPEGKGFITADIARYGGDKTVIGIWNGWRLIKVETINKSGLDFVASEINRLRTQYQIPLSNIIVDEDGVGGGVKDFLHCKGFINNARPIQLNNQDANFTNLKSQCYFGLSDKINKNEVFFAIEGEHKEKIIEELQYVKQSKIDSDGKKSVLRKEDVKELLGHSPDYSDMIMMRYSFELVNESVVWKIY